MNRDKISTLKHLLTSLIRAKVAERIEIKTCQRKSSLIVANDMKVSVRLQCFTLVWRDRKMRKTTTRATADKGGTIEVGKTHS